MKIHSSQPQHPHPAAAMRHAAKAAAETTPTTAPVAPAATEPTTAPTTTTATDAAAPVVAAESTVALAARKKLPPGLVKVAARLEAMGAEGRTGAQSHVLTQITRNLQRYADVHGLAMPAAPAPQAPTGPTPEADPSVPEVDASVPVTPTDPITPPAAPATVAEAMLIDALLDDAAAPTEPAPL